MSEPSGEPAVLRLPESIDLRTIAEMHQSLMAMKGRPLDLDGSAVQRIGGLGLQVLASAFDTWAADGCALQLRDPSEALTRSLEQMGFAPASPAQA
jgi:chemotaxis protein CheX